mgnify:CR=1 FL=1
MIMNEILIITKNNEYKLKRLVYLPNEDIMKDVDNDDIVLNVDLNVFHHSFLYDSHYIIFDKFKYLTINVIDRDNLTPDNIMFYNIPLEYRSLYNINRIFYPLYYILSDNHNKSLFSYTIQRFRKSVVKHCTDVNVDSLIYILTPNEFRHVISTSMNPEIARYVYSLYILSNSYDYNNMSCKYFDYIQAYCYGFFAISIKMRIEFDKMQVRVLNVPSYFIKDKKCDNPDEIIRILNSLMDEFSHKIILNIIPSVIAMVESSKTLVQNMIIQKLQR